MGDERTPYKIRARVTVGKGVSHGANRRETSGGYSQVANNR